MKGTKQNGVGPITNGKISGLSGMAKGTMMLCLSHTYQFNCITILCTYQIISNVYDLENIYHGSLTPEAANHFNEILMNERNYNSIEEAQGDYEAIDTSLFGWWKAKLRKSQIRKVHKILCFL